MYYFPSGAWHGVVGFFKFLLIDEKERETSIYYSTSLCIRWLLLVCALTRDQTWNFGVLGQCSTQVSYPARTLGLCWAQNTWTEFSVLF